MNIGGAASAASSSSMSMIIVFEASAMKTSGSSSSSTLKLAASSATITTLQKAEPPHPPSRKAKAAAVSTLLNNNSNSNKMWWSPPRVSSSSSSSSSSYSSSNSSHPPHHHVTTTSQASRLLLRSDFLQLYTIPLSSGQDHNTRTSSVPNSVISARLFGPAIFESSKLKVLFLGDGKDKHPEQMPRAYTLTHSDVTAKLTLAISHTINIPQIQGWYSRLQRDEVLAEWNKYQGSMSLHVHCHISGGHWLLDVIARLRFYIFRKELPVVLEAFRHGDETLFKNHPELEESSVWVYFHSNMEEFNRVEYWGPLREAACKGAPSLSPSEEEEEEEGMGMGMESRVRLGAMQRPPRRCQGTCNCCSPHGNVIPLPASFKDNLYSNSYNYWSMDFDTAIGDTSSRPLESTTPERPSS